MNKTNCAPGGRATQAARGPEERSRLGAMGGHARASCGCKRCSPAALSAIGKKAGRASRDSKTPEERSTSASHAARARWARVWCQLCEASVLKSKLLDGEACPRCRLVL